MSAPEKAGPLEWFFAFGRSIGLVLIFVGAYGAAFGWRLGAYLMLAGIASAIGTDITVAVLNYRRVMRRPWPNVPPLDDWDD